MNAAFDKIARSAAKAAGTSWAFILAVLMIVGWAATGPWFHWSDSHSLFVNTATTIITYLLVFLIQHTQNQDQAEILNLLREVAEDLPQVDDARARRRAREEQEQ